MSLTTLSKRPRDMGYLFVVGGPGGSGSSTIAKMLAKHFQLHYIYGGAFMRQYAEEYGYDDLQSFYKSDDFKNNFHNIDASIDDKILRASHWHDVLIDSKTFAGISYNLQIPTTVKIWLQADLHIRVRRTLHKDGKIDLSMQLPRYYGIYQQTEIKLRDRYFQDKNRYKKLYGFDYARPEKYNDIVVNTSAYNAGETMQLILQMIKDGKYLE